MKAYLDKLGSFGSVVTAAACPGCFPHLAAVGTLVGLGVLGSYESRIFLATKILVALAIVGHVVSYRTQRNLALLVLGAGGGVLFFSGMYLFRSEGVTYLGLAAMLLASATDLVRKLRARRQLRMQTHAE
jgi:mercuric ion transport protein